MGELALTGAALVGTLCLAAALGSVAFGLRPLVFQSGSMSPAIATGDLSIAREVPASELSVGEVVAVRTRSGSRVSHRIVDVTHREGAATLVLKGDANPTVDPDAYDVTEAERVWFTIPRAGYVLGWLSGPAGALVGGTYALLLWSALRSRADRGERGPAPKHMAPRRPVGALVALALVAGAATGGGLATLVRPTLGAWTDPVAVSGSTLTARVIPAPVTSCTFLAVLQGVRVQWTAVDGATSYRLHYGNGTTEDVGGGVTSKTMTSSGSVAVEARVHTFSSPTSNSVGYTVVLGLLAVCL